MTEHRRAAAEDGERLILADRVHRYEAPIGLMFAALTDVRAMWWLRLQSGEVQPRVLQAVPFERVIWTSFWPVSPHDTIVFDLSIVESEIGLFSAGKLVEGHPTAIRFRWATSSPPDDRGIGITRQRLNRKFGGDLRAVVSEFYWDGLDGHDRAAPTRE